MITLTLHDLLQKLGSTSAVDELKQILEKRQPRILRTYVIDGGYGTGDYTFVTTSKDIHLFLGAMSSSCQHCLAEFLEEEFSEIPGFSQLLLRRSSDEKDTGWLVTKFVENNILTFSLSPVY